MLPKKQIHFVCNLRKETFDDRFRYSLKPKGYLLAPDYVTKQSRKNAEKINKQLFADNGNFSLIKDVRERYSALSKNLLTEVQLAEDKLGRKLRRKDVPVELKKRYRALANESMSLAKEFAGEGDKKLQTQLSLKPACLIGVEDITMAVWLALDIEPAYTRFPKKFYGQINGKVASLAKRRAASLDFNGTYYPVASAVSYDTAYDAGRIFADAGIMSVAMGFGAFMADNNYTDHTVLRNKEIKLPLNVPNRYVRTVAVARGFFDGYLKSAGHEPDSFHFLGLGTPIMIVLTALCAWGTKRVTFDATSPIKDASEGTLYSSLPAYMKLRCKSIAAHLASEKNRKWNCACSFCKEFEKKHPFDYMLGNKWFSKNSREVETGDLRPLGGLFKAYPLFSEPSGGNLRKEINFARTGHNHWIVKQAFAKLRSSSVSLNQLEKHAKSVVEDYVNATKSVSFGPAVEFGLQIALKKFST